MLPGNCEKDLSAYGATRLLGGRLRMETPKTFMAQGVRILI